MQTEQLKAGCQIWTGIPVFSPDLPCYMALSNNKRMDQWSPDKFDFNNS